MHIVLNCLVSSMYMTKKNCLGLFNVFFIGFYETCLLQFHSLSYLIHHRSRYLFFSFRYLLSHFPSPSMKYLFIFFYQKKRTNQSKISQQYSQKKRKFKKSVQSTWQSMEHIQPEKQKINT